MVTQKLTPIALLSSGMHYESGFWRPSSDALVRLVAAARIYDERHPDLVRPSSTFHTQPILSLGGLMDGPNAPARSENLKDYLMEYFSIDGRTIYTEKNSIDTDGNAEEAKRILGEIGYLGTMRYLDIVTNAYHLQRASEAFERQGFYPTGICAEQFATDEYLMRLPKEDRERAEEFLRTGPTSENLANTIIRYASKTNIGRNSMRKLREKQIAKNG